VVQARAGHEARAATEIVSVTRLIGTLATNGKTLKFVPPSN
jgi:hypothetical protein